MTGQIIGMAIMILGAVITFGSNKWAKVFFKVETKNSLKSFVIKLCGLGVAIFGMLFVMQIINL